MCDHHHHLNSSVGTNFYQHYLQQHAIMTQFFQTLHQSCNAFSYNNDCAACNCNLYSHMNTNLYSQDSSSTSSSSSDTGKEDSYSSDYEFEDQENFETQEDESDSDCEYELNVDAIIAMRAAKEELNKTSTSESESIVLVDSDKEEFEFVNSESITMLSSNMGQDVGTSRNRTEEMKTKKKIMDYLYGEKSGAISGLETAMAISFEHLCDIHQPSLWPVLPVRL